MATPAPGKTEGLQFERAELRGAAAVCAACRRPIDGVYFQVNGLIACEACRARLEEIPPGSRAGRALRAAGLGILAAAAGSALYYAVSAITGYELGIIAIVVGVFVGKAVRRGSGGRGGWAYQALAMFLTYASIVSTYIPPILKELSDRQSTKAAATSAGGGAALGTSSPAPASAAAAPAAAVTPAPPDASRPRTPGRRAMGLVLAVALLFGLALAAPFLGGFQNAIGLVIIAIGLYEAWKMNRHRPLVVSGPYRVGSTPPPAPISPGV